MAKITALVRSAVGFNETRGDQVQVTNMRFAETEVDAGEKVRPNRCWASTPRSGSSSPRS